MEKYNINIDGNKVVLSRGTMTPLGISGENGCINYVIVGDKAKQYELVFFDKTSAVELGRFNITNDMRYGDIVSVRMEGVADYFAYCFVEDGRRYKDNYAQNVIGREQWAVRNDVIYANYRGSTKACDNRPNISMDDMIIYKLHVRGFTMNKNSKVTSNGTFKGVAEKVEYFKELGINTVMLMPAYDFDEIIYKGMSLAVVGMPEGMKDYISSRNIENGCEDKLNYWGYTRGYYMSPKAAYCKDSTNAMNEFKQMVDVLHKNGIQVFMEFYFVQGTNPLYVVDTLRFWAGEYGIDGVSVNFDVAPIWIIKSDPILSGLKIIGDRWEFINDYSDMNGLDKRFAVCNDNFMVTSRKFLKSDEGQVYDMSCKVKECRNDAGIVHYLANHNTLSLADMVSYDRKHNEANGENNVDGTDYNYSWNCGVEGPTKKKKILELRKKQMKNALTFLFLSQGIPMLYAGDEMGHTTDGNNNPYCQDNDVSYINWNNLRYRKDVFEYVKMLIDFRKKHPVFTMKTEPRMSDYRGIGCPDVSLHGMEPWKTDYDYVSRCFAIMYNEEYFGNNSDGSSKIYIVYNMHWEEKEFNLPANKPGKQWELAFATDDIKIKEARTIVASERTVAVFMEK